MLISVDDIIIASTKESAMNELRDLKEYLKIVISSDHGGFELYE